MNFRFMYDDINDYKSLRDVFNCLTNKKCFQIMKHLNVENIQTVSEIAESLKINQGEVSRTVDRLVRAGLLNRRKTNIGNKKLITINTSMKIKVFEIYNSLYNIDKNN